MCGIFGVLKFKPRNYNYKEAHELLHHRGPDESGFFENESIFFAHHRLSIIDLSSGQQPMTNEDGSVFITYNGEIYNYRQLKKELEFKGHKFISSSDTEVLVHLYEEYGENLLEKINGMFAFAIWDEKKKILFCARDRLGIKPFYYAQTDYGFFFSSEIKSLYQLNSISKELNMNAFFDYISFRYIHGPKTIFSSIQELGPGHFVSIKNNRVEIKKYWDPFNRDHIFLDDKKEAEFKVENMLKESVKSMLVSDVPYGIFLSGGIDSSLILSYMSEILGKNIKAFTIGFAESHFDETSYAKIVAEKFGAELNIFNFTSKDLIDNIIPALSQFDQPFADEAAIPTYLLSRETKKQVKMILTGEGADELFMGYVRYRTLRKNILLNTLLKNVPKFILRFAEKSVNSNFEKFRVYSKALQNIGRTRSSMYYTWIAPSIPFHNIIHPDFLNQFEQYNSEIFLEKYFISNNSVNDARNYDLFEYLPYDLLKKADMMTMSFGLEARVPFLDHKLVEYVLNLPVNWHIDFFSEKKLLKKIASKKLPKNIIKRRKHGFTVPVGKWFRAELKELLLDTLLSKDVAIGGFFNMSFIQKIINDHTSNKCDYSRALWMLFCFEIWNKNKIKIN